QEWFPMDVLFERSDWRPTLYEEEKGLWEYLDLIDIYVLAVQTAAIFVTISCLFSLVIAVWWLFVALKCYRFLRTTHRLRFYLNQWESRKYMPLELAK